MKIQGELHVSTKPEIGVTQLQAKEHQNCQQENQEEATKDSFAGFRGSMDFRLRDNKFLLV